jgi:hypothetical protein
MIGEGGLSVVEHSQRAAESNFTLPSSADIDEGIRKSPPDAQGLIRSIHNRTQSLQAGDIVLNVNKESVEIEVGKSRQWIEKNRRLVECSILAFNQIAEAVGIEIPPDRDITEIFIASEGLLAVFYRAAYIMPDIKKGISLDNILALDKGMACYLPIADRILLNLTRLREQAQKKSVPPESMIQWAILHELAERRITEHGNYWLSGGSYLPRRMGVASFRPTKSKISGEEEHNSAPYRFNHGVIDVMVINAFGKIHGMNPKIISDIQDGKYPMSTDEFLVIKEIIDRGFQPSLLIKALFSPTALRPLMRRMTELFGPGSLGTIFDLMEYEKAERSITKEDVSLPNKKEAYSLTRAFIRGEKITVPASVFRDTSGFGSIFFQGNNPRTPLNNVLERRHPKSICILEYE